jgi:DNA-binding HxlR family transcriptional regulator
MRDDRSPCPVHASMQLLQEKWTLHIVRALLAGGACGFNQLRRAVGCNPATLTQRLAGLEQQGIVSRTVQSVVPPRTSYALTPAGAALRQVIDAIAGWGRAHLGAGATNSRLRARRSARPAGGTGRTTSRRAPAP